MIALVIGYVLVVFTAAWATFFAVKTVFHTSQLNGVQALAGIAIAIALYALAYLFARVALP